ncbi:MAG: phosphoenolpyruvate synthase [Pseudomonadales bacterium]|jgi:pyruvate,water dikinase|nr:phosphoenolpyruvate synthase [Pseudomonadales bacterium]MCP5336972.1 phosphoenolpyruvate synthase [Pseudomonadales bacterium]
MTRHLVWFDELGMGDVARVGGKNASLGEMISSLAHADVRVPDGFATTADAYREFLAQDGLDRRIAERLAVLDVDDVAELARAGAEIRGWIRAAPLSQALRAEVETAYARLGEGREVAVAVRSSATAEDLPDASFAGQQETYLNIRGLDRVVEAIHEVFASLFNDRAIAYRVHKGFDHAQVALSAGIQRMVRSETGASGVMFTLDTESGFNGVVFITAAYGLGETVVQGAVNPDEFYVFKETLQRGKDAIVRRNLGDKKLRMVYTQDAAVGATTVTETVPEELQHRFCISDDEVLELGRIAMRIEAHYGRAMDIEWARDGDDGRLYVLQARPETVRSQQRPGRVERYLLREKGKLLCEGRAIGHRIGSGVVRVIRDVAAMEQVREGDVLVTDMTDPDWEPIMKRAAAVVTNRGGRTCHAAIIARELGIPAVVGCGNATETIPDGQVVTVSCAEGEQGHVYAGRLDYEVASDDVSVMPPLPFKLMMNVGNPDRAFDFCQLPNDGVGLARLEFIINRMIGVHPKALLEFDRLDGELRDAVARRIRGYTSPTEYFVAKLSEGVATIAAAFHPKPVIVRLSDFKSNEYAHLVGGQRYEPVEENPMLGFRGASRYIDAGFRDCFELECRALRYIRDEMGLDNVEVMVPFVRTVAEASAVVELLAANGLRRGENGLRVIMMCEIPSNALLAERFLEHFDGFSIGSNDLTQLTLGLDRDSGLVAGIFDERDEAVKMLLKFAIDACNRHRRYIGICGQGPSDHPDLAAWLVEQGIQSMSLNPDVVVDSWQRLATLH